MQLTRYPLKLCLLAAILAAGCNTLPTAIPNQAPLYAAPASGPLAKLLLRVSIPDGRYTLSTFSQPVGCSGRQDFVSSTLKDPERQTVVLSANKLQTISFLHETTDRRTCQVIVSFQPRSGNTYLMRNRSTADSCSVELINATNPDAPSVEASRIKRERIGYGKIDNACKPLISTVTTPSTPAPAGGLGPPGQAPNAESLDAFKDLLPKR